MAAKRRVGLGLLGYGNIGKEVFSYYRDGRSNARVVRIARRRFNRPAPQAVKKLLVRRAEQVIADPDAEIIVELTGDAERGAQ